MPSGNPLWFGYYPGDRPVFKRPERQLPPKPPVDMSDMGLNPALDEAIKAVEVPADMPRQVWDWIVDDLKFRFLVGASPYTQTGTDLYEFDREEVADVKGAYVTVNIVDLIKDPKKTVSKFIEKSLNTVNPLSALTTFEGEFWTDLDTTSERAMWAKLLDPNRMSGKLPLGFRQVRDAFGPLDFEDQKVYAKSKIFSPSAKAAAIAAGLKDQSGIVEIAAGSPEGEDVYQQVRENTLGFVSGKKSAFTRNNSYRSMQSAFIKAAATELENKDSAVKAALSTVSPNPAETALRIEAFKAEKVLVDDIEDIEGLRKKLKNLQDELAKTGFTGTVSAVDVQEALGELNTAAIKVGKQIGQVKKAFVTPGLQLTRDSKMFDRSVRGLEGFVADAKSLSSTSDRERLKSQVAQLSSRLTNNRYSGGIHDHYLQSVGRRYFQGNTSLLNLASMTDAANKPIFSEGYASLNTVYKYQKRIYFQEDARDIIDAVSKGEFGKTYIWIGQVRDRVQMFTPGYWVGQVVDRTHKFGLVYDEDVKVLHPIFNKNPLIRNNVFTEKFTVNYGGAALDLSAKLAGSKHLRNFYDAWTKASDGKLIGAYDATSKTVSSWGSADQNYQAFFDLLNGRSANISALGGNLECLIGKDDKTWTHLVSDWSKMRDDLGNSGLGLDISAGEILNSDKNKAILGGFFERIKQRKANAATTNPFMNRIGALQIYASKLSLLQQKIFTVTRLNKLVDVWVHTKNAVSQRLVSLASKVFSKVGSKGLAAALGAATGGLAAVLAPVLERVLQAIVAKIIDVAKGMAKAVLKGDLTGEMNKMMNDAAETTQKVIACGCFVPVFLALAVLMLMASIIGSISPVDRARDVISSIVGTLPTPPEPMESTNCVFPSYRITAKSYNGPNDPPVGSGGSGTWRHGSNDYWFPKDDMDGDPGYNGDIDGIKDCSYPIPSLGGSAAWGPLGNSGSWCDGQSSKKSYYGYALDVIPSSGSGDEWAFAPDDIGIDDETGKVLSWDISARGELDSGTGCAMVLEGNNGSHTYSIYLLHLRCNSLVCGLHSPCWREPNQPLAQMHDFYLNGNLSKHVHIEMQIDGEYVRPEDHMCY